MTSEGRTAPVWDPASAAAFYDAYGEREWTRFEDGRFSAPAFDVHVEHLRRFVHPGDRVLDIGAGPGRFTIELARLGADVVAADISPQQVELNRAHVAAAGFEARVSRPGGRRRDRPLALEGRDVRRDRLFRRSAQLRSRPGR